MNLSDSKGRIIKAIRFEFPAKLTQVADNAVVMEAREFEGPFFAEKTIEQIAPDLSPAEQDKLADEIVYFAQQEALRRSIRIY